MFDPISPGTTLAAVFAANPHELNAVQCLGAIHDLDRVLAVVEARKAELYTRFVEAQSRSHGRSSPRRRRSG
ncbi:MAG TPA: hypothetical protein VLJ59_01260 [Mycobacteriales bacterium]|nr:hypothetical protein [Mycobacteriales bacterium]